MRHLPDFEPFPSHLIDDMHKAFEVVCARLRLTPQSDKATALVVTKIVELAKVGSRGDGLIEQTLVAFQGNEPAPRSREPLASRASGSMPAPPRGGP
jgi:hypothetical protein